MILSPAWLARACKLNPIFQSKLRFVIRPGWPTSVSSPEFAEMVASFQKEAGLDPVDGVLGPVTLAKVNGDVLSPPAAGGELIVDGSPLQVPFPVVTWKDPAGLSFYLPETKTFWATRRNVPAKVNLFVLHWDGCTSSRQCYQVLVERHLSVHLMLDADGTVFQALDLATAKAYHASVVNERSVGVEICNPVTPSRNRYCSPPRAVIADKGVNGSHDAAHLDFYDVQKERVVQLANALAEIFGIPKVLPRAPRWKSHLPGEPDPAGSVIRRTLEDVQGFAGVCGHFHVSDQKDDPGNTLWDGLSVAGWG